jgi:hypothetical protein
VIRRPRAARVVPAAVAARVVPAVDAGLAAEALPVPELPDVDLAAAGHRRAATTSSKGLAVVVGVAPAALALPAVARPEPAAVDAVRLVRVVPAVRAADAVLAADAAMPTKSVSTSRLRMES